MYCENCESFLGNPISPKNCGCLAGANGGRSHLPPPGIPPIGRNMQDKAFLSFFNSIPQVGIGGGVIPVDAMQSGKKAQLDPNDFYFGTQDLMPVKFSKPIEARSPPFPGADWPY